MSDVQAPAVAENTQEAPSAPPKPSLKVVDLLHEAAAIVGGSCHASRDRAYGPFSAIAADWTAYLANRREPASPIRPHDVAHMMVRLNQQRAEWGAPLREHAVDAAGYSALAGALWGDRS